MNDLENILQQMNKRMETVFIPINRKIIDASTAKKIVTDVLESKPKNLEITKMLTVSTKHVEQETFERLMQEDVRNEIGVPVYTKSTANGQNYGLYIYINPNIESEPVPKELMSIIIMALVNGCGIICLDSDGPEIDTLPIFEWTD